MTSFSLTGSYLQVFTVFWSRGFVCSHQALGIFRPTSIPFHPFKTEVITKGVCCGSCLLLGHFDSLRILLYYLLIFI